MANDQTIAATLKPFRDLPYGTKFRYQGSKEVWVRTQHNVIAEWPRNLSKPGHQSLCCFCHEDGDEDGNTLDTLVEVCEPAPVAVGQQELMAYIARVQAAACAVVGHYERAEQERGSPYKETFRSPSTGKTEDNAVTISVRLLNELRSAVADGKARDA